jgi:shikimate kinase
MNVALTGFMGAGKSTVGRKLSRLLGIPFADTDAEIVRAHGPIPQIFAVEGEAKFRRYERAALERLTAAGPCVIAVGGGGVIAPENRALLRKTGVIVHLSISPETAHRRVAHRTHRPLLGPAPTLDGVRGLLEKRATAYADCDFTIKVDGRTPMAVAQTIARWYRARRPAKDFSA